ncbi:alpha/beta fold hydrolase [Aestuariivirga sp.]|uniref:alpha/beta hydrolase n=1 Tax=Aestuariivirga sp. TaxID=2650926 RepID=UPI0025C3BABC|nr:alpha/beta fold hydrolase [Aestuariivirga sp.]MCA3556082.1 alpha/beta fold hydrolase [Aestuariivirga sp.]
MLKSVLIVAVLAYAAIVGFMYLQQRSLQYHPAHKGTPPQAMGLSGVTEERVKTPDGETIVLWYVPAQPDRPTVLFFHGNAGEIADRTERFAFLQAQGFGVLFVSYRGYGASTGTISEQGLIADALTAYDFLIAKGVSPQQIVLLGESLGTGVAVQLAARKPVAAVALEAPYTATVDIASEIYWWLPVRLLMKDQFRSRDYIGQVKAPLLIHHGDADTIVPVAQGRALFAMANEPKELVIIPGGTHDAVFDRGVWEREADFFRANTKAFSGQVDTG